MTTDPTGLVGSNDVIDRLRENPGEFVVKTLTRKGPVYHYDRTLTPIRREVAERLIRKGRLVPREDSGQGWELSDR